MYLLNFSHPMTPAQIEAVAHLTGQEIREVIDLPVQFDPSESFLPQLKTLAAQIPLSSQQMQTEPLVVNPPSLNFITALLLAELHGRMGYFPPVVRMRPVKDSLPPRYEVAEVLNLQTVRDQARLQRQD